MARNTLKLVFKDQANNTRIVSISNAKESYDDGEVKEKMDQMIQSNALLTKEGPIATKDKAYLEALTVTPIGLE